MSQQDKLHRLNSLAHIPLIKSPFLRVPSAVTLPYDYVQLPSPQSIAAPPPLPDLGLPGQSELEVQQARYAAARSKAEVWQEQVEQRRLHRARRLAPGFLDTGVTLLTPVKSGAASVPASVKTQEDTLKEYFEGLQF
ncbi:hypothetical protein BCR37DRAFT_401444 [Protomyces lactucae-debilis]|uniref:Uncharacterized protein n=1 Tax=Protomyces lactucae-debilis TaxID=2754530 RepID=A0A1Y2ERV9_PROLT|nr:uncharacterized protein BCR37DRAFT_401444 [Protomyces lactucae-debilis]ORY73916.1 hypothetical protein BCR37DRAFT_401444 [Protomyces lactucae-debilis]